MRRKNPTDTKDEDDKGRKSTQKIMPLNYIKICFGILIGVSLIVYIYLYMSTPKHPSPMSPEMEALYKEHGPGEPKTRRRPDLNDNMGDKTKSLTEDDENKKLNQRRMDEEKREKEKVKKFPTDEAIHIGIVACGNRAPEAIISLKSFAMLSNKPLQFHVFAEDALHGTFKNDIEKWPGYTNGQINLDIHSIQFPGEGNFNEWKKLFKPCASQRLFFPLLLKDVDAIIYVDTDVLVLTPPENLWNFFKRFNKTQLAGMIPEGEIDAIGWYNRFARHPYYGRLGLNSGVMLMNLTRMRRENWNNDVYPIYKHYQYDIVWGDQDILNIMFHFKPEHMFVVPCEWNYRPDHCMYGNNCETALHHGIAVVHGNRGVFHNEKQPEFKVIYEAFRTTKFGDGMKKKLKQKIKKGLEKYKSTYCGENRHIFSRKL